MKPLHRTTAALTALLLAASPAACSSSGRDGAEPSADSTAPTGQSPQAPPTASAQPSEAPAGYRTVTAPTSKIAFAVPQDWMSLESTDLQDDQTIQMAANALGRSPDEIRQLSSSLDLITASPSPANNSPDAVYVTPAPIASLPDEESMRQHVEQRGGAPGEYSTRRTGLGDVAVETYSLALQTTPQDQQGREELHAVSVAAPNRDGEWAVITVTATDASRATELTDVVVSTLRAPS